MHTDIFYTFNKCARPTSALSVRTTCQFKPIDHNKNNPHLFILKVKLKTSKERLVK